MREGVVVEDVVHEGRANSAQIRQSGPDSGLGLSHLGGGGLEPFWRGKAGDRRVRQGVAIEEVREGRVQHAT